MAGHPPLEQMSAEDLRDYVHAVVDRLADEEHDSVLANLIRRRIKLAATLLRGLVA